jgi:hypothetical protein
VKHSIPPEHDFTLSFEAWEQVVFGEATRFIAAGYRGRGTREYHSFATLPEAIEAARNNDRLVVYAIAPSGRCIACDRADWPRWLELQNKGTQMTKAPQKAAKATKAAKQGKARGARKAPEAKAAKPKASTAAPQPAPLAALPALAPAQATAAAPEAAQEPAPAVKTPRNRDKPPAGADWKPVREGSSLATILRLMLPGDLTLEQIAERSGVEPGVFSTLDKVKHRIKHVLRVGHGIGHVVDDETKHVRAILPDGVSEATAIRPAPGG